ncbi:hypothetical protein [Streptomyces mexicanus]|uniref:hypothetical protein n=1 Tax=Streptomyces mexicanus TaxID=178566 RepID=UPI003661149D
MSRPIPEHGTSNRYAYGCRCRPCTKAATRADAERKLDRLAGRPRQIPAAPAAEHARALLNRGLTVTQIARESGLEPSTIRRLVGGQKEILAVNAAKILAIPLNVRVTAGDVPAVGATRRIRALYALGHFNHLIAKEAGISRDAVCAIAAGKWPTIKVSVDDGIRAAYDRLSMRPGQSWKTRSWAEKHGWAPPLAWDDERIDDPQARPDFAQDEGPSVGEGVEYVDLVAVDAYLSGRSVTVTDAERFAALLAAPERGLSMLDVDKVRGLPAKESEKFLRRMTMRYQRAGLPLPEVGAEIVMLPPMKRSAARVQNEMEEAA